MKKCVDRVQFCLSESKEIKCVSFRNDESVVLGYRETISDGICKGVLFYDSFSVICLYVTKQATLTSFLFRGTHIKNLNCFVDWNSERYCIVSI